MQPEDSQILESYVPVYDAAPDKWEDARPFIVEQLKRLANAINVREIGFFSMNNYFRGSHLSQVLVN